jgi:hypothetical protein
MARSDLLSVAELCEKETAEIYKRLDQWSPTLKLQSVFEHWLATQVVVASIELEKARREETFLTYHMALRARLTWDDDRKLLAEIQGERLAKNPPRVILKLRGSMQGVDWIVVRLRVLEAILDRGETWTEAQKSLALDLLGTPRDLRDQHNPAAIQSGDPVAIRALLLDEIDRLERYRDDELVDLDEGLRTAALNGIPLEPNPEIIRNRRRENAWYRRLLWAHNELRAL